MGFRLAWTIVEDAVGAGDPSQPVAPFTNATSAPVIGSGAPGQERREHQGDSAATVAKLEGSKRSPEQDSADPYKKPAILQSHARSQALTGQPYRGTKRLWRLSLQGKGIGRPMRIRPFSVGQIVRRASYLHLHASDNNELLRGQVENVYLPRS